MHVLDINFSSSTATGIPPFIPIIINPHNPPSQHRLSPSLRVSPLTESPCLPSHRVSPLTERLRVSLLIERHCVSPLTERLRASLLTERPRVSLSPSFSVSSLTQRLRVSLLTERLRISLLDGVVHALGGDHGALHGVVRALDLGHVHEAGAAADQAAAGERQPRQALQAALVQRARTVRDPVTGRDTA